MSFAGCPCGSGLRYGECCGPFLRGESEAPTAEALMRSRYTAYVRRASTYLLRTWHPATRPAILDLVGDDTMWLGLDVVSADAGGPTDDAGVVTFEAWHEGLGGLVETLSETSRFVRESGAWFYVDGDVS